MRPALSIFSSKRFRQAVSILVLLAMLAGGLVFLSRALRVNDGYYKNRPFLADQRDYDVLFFGTSHIINSVLPMQLWKEYGITSYNLGIHGGSVACSYWMMRNAVEQHKPKIAVMETFLTHAQYTSMETALAHAAFDPFPMNKTKIQGIVDAFPKNSDRYELFFPLDVFHPERQSHSCSCRPIPGGIRYRCPAISAEIHHLLPGGRYYPRGYKHSFP